MTAEIVRRPGPAASPHPSLLRRVYGLGSIFGKTLRDSRWSILIVAAVLGVMIVAGGGTMASTYGTPETRAELAMMSKTLPPALVGIYGDPLRVDTLGGFISWHYGAYFALLAGLWSILALSSTLAGEAKRGSLEFAAVTPRSRRILAFEKLAAHVAAVVVAMTIVGVLTWMTGAAFATFEGDRVGVDASIAFVVGIGLKALIAGSIAFAIAPLLGRGAAAGIAGGVMLAGYLLNSYRGVVTAFDGPANLTWFAWTRGHVPLAGGVRLAIVGARRDRHHRPVRSRHRSLRPTGHRGDGRAQDAPPAAAAARRSRADRPLVRREPADRRVVGRRPRAVRVRHGRVQHGVHRGAATHTRGPGGIPEHHSWYRPRHVSRVPAVRLHRHGPGACRPRGSDVRRGLVVRRIERALRAPVDDTAHPGSVGAGERPRRLAGHPRHGRTRGHRADDRRQRKR